MREGTRMKRAILLTTSSLAAIAAALATLALVLVAGANPAVAASSLVNGNVETGNLSGWTVDTTNGGYASAAASHDYLYIAPAYTCGMGPCFTEATMFPKEGSYFALLTSGSSQSEATRISQPFKASNGDKVSGWAFFYTESWLPYDDKAQVVVKSASGTTVATPFEESVSSVGNYGNSGWKYWEHTFSDVTGEGDFQIEARVGNAGAGYHLSRMGLDDVKTSTGEPDTIDPDTTITSQPTNPTNSTTASFSFSSSESGSTFECSNDNQTWATCTSPHNYSGTPLQDGSYNFYVRAKDAAGNVDQTPANYTWTVDTAPRCTKTGTANAETISGTSGDDVICAGGGNDTVNGLGGNDTLRGEAGNDTLLGGTGSDALDGGLGTDTASYAPSLTAVSASLAANTATGEGSDTFLGVENLLGSSKADSLTGSNTDNRITGGGAGDALKGGGGNDQVIGSGGADSLFGEDGNDAVDSKDGTNGNDSLDGGSGTDTKVTDTRERSITGFP
jgi:Ca2+-binding RTX toxin-like protein